MKPIMIILATTTATQAFAAKTVSCYLNDLEFRQGDSYFVIGDFDTDKPELSFELGPYKAKVDTLSYTHTTRKGAGLGGNNYYFKAKTVKGENSEGFPSVFQIGQEFTARYYPLKSESTPESSGIVVLKADSANSDEEATIIGECNNQERGNEK